MSSGIYQIINTVNNKSYIGSACNIHKRWLMHKRTLKQGSHHNIHLQRAWYQYGITAFTLSVVEEILNKSKLIDREQYYLNTLKPEYNICFVAGNQLGQKQSKEARQKKSLKLKGRPKSEEHKRRISESNKGKLKSEDHKQKLSAVKIGKNNPFFGKIHSTSSREKMKEMWIKRKLKNE
jgi:group I intron endonuclease